MIKPSYDGLVLRRFGEYGYFLRQVAVTVKKRYCFVDEDKFCERSACLPAVACCHQHRTEERLPESLWGPKIFRDMAITTLLYDAL
jgi:hypothetical protein